MAEETTELVFVYGTLKRGLHNSYLLDNDEFVTTGETKEKYVMTEDGIPYVSELIPYSTIQGEIFRVTNTSMHTLDMLESHPTWYERRQVLIVAEDGVEHNCWLYFNDKTLGSLINIDGDYGSKESRRIPIQQQQEGAPAN